MAVHGNSSLACAKEQVRRLIDRWYNEINIAKRKQAIRFLRRLDPKTLDLTHPDEQQCFFNVWNDYECKPISENSRSIHQSIRQRIAATIRDGQDTIEPIFMWLKYYHPVIANRFFDIAFEDKKWEFYNIGFVPNWPPKAPALSSHLRKLDASFKKHTDAYLNAHVKHQIEDRVVQLLKTNEHRHALLVAGPGIGKTAIMSSIVERLRKEYVCIPYFFRYTWSEREQREPELFYEYVAANLFRYFPTLKTSEHSKLSGAKLLNGLLEDLEGNDLLSAERPLFIAIDGLDEMPGKYEGQVNPLSLDSMLSDNVRILQSTRFEPSPSKLKELKSYSHYFHIQKDEALWGDHQKTAIEYVEKTCEENKSFIRPFDVLSRDEDKLAFATGFAKAAGYNFVIMRWVLADKEGWQKIGELGVDWDANAKKLRLAPEVEDFYEQNYERMLDGLDISLCGNALYAFILISQISEQLFLTLLDGKSVRNSNSLTKCKNDIWKRQGLIEENSFVLSLYHRTFREFLEGRFEHEDRVECLAPVKQNMQVLCKFDSGFDSLDELSPKTELDWLQLSLKIAAKTQNLKLLRQLAFSLSFWQRVLRHEGEFLNTLAYLKSFVALSAKQEDLDVFLEELAGLIYKWAENGLLMEPGGGRTFHTYEIIENLNAATSNDNNYISVLHAKISALKVAEQ